MAEQPVPSEPPPRGPSTFQVRTIALNAAARVHEGVGFKAPSDATSSAVLTMAQRFERWLTGEDEPG